MDQNFLFEIGPVNAMVITRKSLRQNVLNTICFELVTLSKQTKNGRVPYGAVSRILKENIVDNPWLNRDEISFEYKKYKNGLAQVLEAVEDDGNSRTGCILIGWRMLVVMNRVEKIMETTPNNQQRNETCAPTRDTG